MGRKPLIFYGWVIVGIGAIAGTLIYGIRNSFSVFFPPILDEFGWQRGSTAIMLSLHIFIYGILSPVAGGLSDRWKPRNVMSLGVCVLGLATAGCAFAREQWHFYLLFGVLVPIGSAFCGAPVFGAAVMNWFVKRRGLVIGLVQTGGALSFVYGMFVEVVISHLGWRSAYLIIAGILVVIMLPLYLFLFHYRPENKGLSPYGALDLPADMDPAPARQQAVITARRDWTFGEAIRTYQMWMLVLSYFFYWGIGYYLVLAHQVKFAVDAGYSSVFAASIFAIYGLFMLSGQLSASISDRLGREATAVLATMLGIGALVSLILVRDTSHSWLLYVYALCFGYGGGLYLPTLFAGLGDLFQGRNFGAIGGLVITGMGLGGAIGPWLGGYIYDITGSYINAFIFSILCILLGCAAFWVAAPRNASRMRGRE